MNESENNACSGAPSGEPKPSEGVQVPVQRQIEPNFPAGSPDTGGADKQTDFRDWIKKLWHDNPDRVIELALAAAIVIFSFFQLVVTMVNDSSTAKQVDKIIGAANQIQTAANNFSQSASRINTGIANAVTQLGIQAGAANTQAGASRTLAGITAKQFSFNEQIAESQRAAISVEVYRILNPLTFHQGALSEAFSILLINNGQIRATDIVMRFKPSFIQWGQDEFVEPSKRQAALCDKPPTSEEEKFSEVAPNGNVIFAGGHEEMQINFGMAAPTQEEIIEWPPDSAYKQNPGLAVPQTGRVHPIIVGCVDYRSGSMPGKHQTGFIFDIEKTGESPGLPTFINLGVDVPQQNLIISKYYFSQGKNY